MDFKEYALQLPPASSSEKCHGIDPDYRCITTALWRWWRILGSPSRYLVIDNQPTIKKSRCLVFAAMQVALLGPTSAANSKSDECGLASVYSTNSEETASGEDTQPQNFTGAHRSLPFGTLVHVGNQVNGRSVVIRITDRGPFRRRVRDCRTRTPFPVWRRFVSTFYRSKKVDRYGRTNFEAKADHGPRISRVAALSMTTRPFFSAGRNISGIGRRKIGPPGFTTPLGKIPAM